MDDPLTFAWWNLENLFDTERAKRSEKLRRTIGFELKGWNAKVLGKKLANLAAVIRTMNAGREFSGRARALLDHSGDLPSAGEG